MNLALINSLDGRRAAGTPALTSLVLLAFMGASHAATTVNCANGDSSALSTMSQNGTLSGEVQINGTCVGNVVLFVSGITLDKSPSSVAAIQIHGTVSITAPNITLSGIVIDGGGASAQGVQIFGNVSGTILNGITVQNFPASGITAGGPGSVFIEGGTISGNKNCGLFAFNGIQVELDSNVEITGNGSGSSANLQCGIDVEDGAGLFVTAANVHDNTHGPALRIFQATGDLTGGTFEAPASVTAPAVVLERATLNLQGVTITGSGHSSAVFATPGTAIKMQSSSVVNAGLSDPAILIGDGSTLLSVGGNTICAGSLGGLSCTPTSGGTAVTVTNNSTLHQRIETNLNTPVAADAITGAGTVQVQSNLDLGTGSGAPSTWTGDITVQQNSSFRMSGGVTVTGAVRLKQASNAFFNLTLGGNNVVTGAVNCMSSTTPTSHVAAAAGAVTLTPGGADAVTFGNTQPACLSF